jgi:transcription-repair coupling factor (superfamily II helicase)
VSNIESPYYKSKAFDRLLEFVKNNYRRTQLNERNNRRTLTVGGVDSVEKAVGVLEEIK